MANPKLSTFADSFTGSVINTGLWSVITAGVATLDTVNDCVSVAVPVASGGISTFGTNGLYDATNSAIYAQVSPAANGNGGTKTIMRVRLDANNAVTMRIESRLFRLTIQNAGAFSTIDLPTYDANAHRWWRIREAGGTFYADASSDGLIWSTLASTAYSWDASAVSFRFEAQASVTEVAGNTMVVSHVNTRLGGPLNLNSPLIEHGWGALWNANNGIIPNDRYVDITTRTQGTTATQRGRQYELDQVQAGTLSETLVNTDGALDPANTAGPWAGNVRPYQPYRMRAQWPPTRNLMNQAAATGGETLPLGTIPQTVAFSETDTTNGSVVASASAWQGSQVFQFAVPSTTAVGKRVAYVLDMAGAPSATYTLTMRVRNVTTSTSLDVKAHIGWYGPPPLSPPIGYAYGAVTTLAGSASAGWTTLTLTATLPANAYGINAGFSVATTAAATCNLQVDGWQLEPGGTATGFVAPGTWFSAYSGFIERWPQSWNLDNTFGVVQPTAVDAFALLSQRTLNDPLTEEINKHNPRFIYKLDDPAGSQTLADATGNYSPAPLARSKYGSGSITFGNAITATDTDTGIFTGSNGTVARVNNPNPGTNLLSAATYIDLSASGIHGPNFSADWSRMICFRYTGPTPTAGNWATLWLSADRSSRSQAQMSLVIGDDGKFKVFMIPALGGGVSLLPPAAAGTVLDGDWHLATLSYDHVAQNLSVSLDGYVSGTYAVASVIPANLVSDSLGAWIDPGTGGGSSWNFKGDICYAAEFATGISIDDVYNLYFAWKNSLLGDSTDKRYSRILSYAGYTGKVRLDAGATTSMGPAVIDGQDALSALQAIVDTEGGAHYVSADGTVTFQARTARYNAVTPAVVFGERQDLGEMPYEDITLDYDPTHLGNITKVTQESTSQVFTAQDATSQANYFPRTIERTVNASNPLECQDAANYLLSQYKDPNTRISMLRLHPAAYPALWSVCLALELGTRIRVMRRAVGRPVITLDAFVESVQWSFDDTNEATVTIQCSPVDNVSYGLFADWHTTLAADAPAGSTSLSVRAPQNNSDPLAAQLPVGYPLFVNPSGTFGVDRETVTFRSAGATSSGWTTGTVNLMSPTTQFHAAGTVICEPLPAGVSDPAAFDSVSAFDAIAFSY